MTTVYFKSLKPLAIIWLGSYLANPRPILWYLKSFLIIWNISELD